MTRIGVTAAACMSFVSRAFLTQHAASSLPLTTPAPPPDDDMLRYMINKGRRDARAWAQRMELVPQDAAAGRTEGEGAGDVGGGAERGAARVAEAEERREAEGAAGGVEDTGARQGGEGGATARSEAEAEAVKQAAGGGKK